jgi:serine/threonine protein phosphatase PrpC
MADPLPAPPLVCPSCGASVGADEGFCESCGAALSAPAPAPAPAAVPAARAGDVSTASMPPPAAGQCSCGGTFDADGWCDTCGAKQQRERDHWAEQPAPWIAGVCDKGVRHPRNEDAMALLAEAEPGTSCVLVVCDGVTTATASAAARAARDALSGVPRPADASPSARITHWSDALVAATALADDQAVAVAATVAEGLEPPSCTFVAAVVDRGVVVAAWVGDSRAYWLPDAGEAVQLTVDHSWATAQIALGTPRAVAEAAPEAHGITRWLGIDAPDPVPELASVTAEGPGWVLACSDGLWNYCSAATDLRALVAGIVAEHGAEPAAVAAGLVGFANGQGGIDNVTAAVARLDPPPTSSSPAPGG